jgi:N-acetylmuramoyl-L-alanine amidase
LESEAKRQPILRRGASGPAVFALREHLRRVGFKFGGERDYSERTESAVREFQTNRGLRADGICGPQTWAALLEAGFALGDRILAVRRPNLRGDDVAALQHRLSALGFDPGRPDGILGPNTELALREFQRNAGIASDGVCGPATIVALDRLDALAGGSVVELRERERLEHEPRTMFGRRVALHADSSHRALTEALADALRTSNVDVLLLLGDDDGAVARAANDAGADLIVAVREPEAPDHRLSYFGTNSFRSVGGHTHAHHLAVSLTAVLGPGSIEPRTYSILRETRMAAMVLHLSLEHLEHLLTPGSPVSPGLIEAIVCGIRSGFEAEIVPPPDEQR